MPDDLLTPADVAYMRGTQAQAMPTEALHSLRASTRTPTGGVVTTYRPGVPVNVRVDANPDEIPDTLTARAAGGTLARITGPILLPSGGAWDVRDGDQIVVPVDAAEGPAVTTTYEVVSDGEQDTWATAQTVWARRLNRPTRT